MKLGIDFGTTRIVVAAVDRGNYPLVPFETTEGIYDWFPSLAAVRTSIDGSEYRFGWDAWDVQNESGWTAVRSLKRYIDDAGPSSVVAVGGRHVPLADLLAGLTQSLHQTLSTQYGEKLEVMLGVPAHANSNQRFLTVDAFRRAGFEVLGLINEPSAAAIEYGHRQKTKGKILVYDLGGGTFDVSLVNVEGGQHTVLASDGISNLGGDDFDHVLAELAMAGISTGGDEGEGLYGLQLAEYFHLLEECRRQKEALHPNSRRIVVDLDSAREGLGQVTVNVADFYEQCRPLLAASLEATMRLAEGQNIDTFYVTGGGSELPLVARVLRDEFGRKVKRSEYTRSATAIGLAIHADDSSGYKLREMFTRNFGVWRETDGGQRLVFDPIFPYGTRLPAAGAPPETVTRRYYPVHNIGHFRYLEANHVGESQQPEGDIALWDEIQFPFDPSLSAMETLAETAVAHSPAAESQEIEEHYACDAAGGVTVTIRNLTSHYSREYRLGRWSPKTEVIRPVARRKKKQ
ncbi:MAG: Hsp70 family protein [Bryobacteraceae bacterium]